MGNFEDKLKMLRNDHEVADFLLVSESGREWPVHKAILFTRSDVLYRMSTSKDFIESQNGRVVLKEVHDDSVDAMVDYFYSPPSMQLEYIGGVDDYNSIKDHARKFVELCRLADMYNIEDLTKEPTFVLGFSTFFRSKKNIDYMGLIVDALYELDAPNALLEIIRRDLHVEVGWRHPYKVEKVMDIFTKHPELGLEVIRKVVQYASSAP